jgi:hypothetical protein
MGERTNILFPGKRSLSSQCKQTSGTWTVLRNRVFTSAKSLHASIILSVNLLRNRKSGSHEMEVLSSNEKAKCFASCDVTIRSFSDKCPYVAHKPASIKNY